MEQQRIVKQSQARQLIMASDYAEFPDILINLELCRAFARVDKRSPSAALRGCALARLPTVKNSSLRATLEVMAKSPFPETQITRLRACLEKMEKKLAKELGDRSIAEINDNVVTYD
ncbi:particle associated protein [Yersinia phage fHe-Yen8-01]|nr:particle associated protein [Yersinia phage fHe-Yen8-01]